MVDPTLRITVNSVGRKVDAGEGKSLVIRAKTSRWAGKRCSGNRAIHMIRSSALAVFRTLK
jgi:hypothetical protein